MAETLDQQERKLKNATPRERDVAEKQTEKPDVPVVTRPVRHYRAYLFQGYLIAATFAFFALFVLAQQFAYFSFDLPVARAIQSVRDPAITFIMEFISGLGFNPLVYLLCALVMLFVYVVGLKWESVMLLFAAVGVSVLGAIVKLVVHRQRPSADLVNVFSRLNDYSFPSGHVLLFTAFLGFLLFLIFTLTPRSWVRTLGLVFMTALVALVGISRVYLGEHWPSDVLGGYLLGSLWLVVTVYVYRWGKPRFFVNQPLAKEKPVAQQQS